MPDACPVLPPEIVHTIISRAIAQHLDDVLVGASCLHAYPAGDVRESEIAAPVTALLAVSCQVRQTALIALSEALGIALSRVGIWRLEEKPWTKIKPARQLLHRTLDFQGHDGLLLGRVLKMVQTASPVLAVYIYAHALDELGAHPFESLHIPASQGEAPRTLDSIGVASLFDLYIKDKYTECPPVFQEVLSARMEGALARSVVANFYSALINSLSEAWAAIEDLPNRIDSESPYDSVLMCEKVAGDIATILQEMRPRERELVRSWPHTVSLDATIGADRFSEWCRLFEDMSQWEFDGDGAQELREVAKDFAEYFRGRLGKLDIRFSRSTSRYT